MSKIRKFRKILEEPKKNVSEIAKNNKILNTSKDNTTNNKMILSYKQRQKDEFLVYNNSNYLKIRYFSYMNKVF